MGSTQAQLDDLMQIAEHLQHCIDRISHALNLPVYLPGDLVSHASNPGRRLIVLGTDVDQVRVRSADFEGGIVSQANVEDLHRYPHEAGHG